MTFLGSIFQWNYRPIRKTLIYIIILLISLTELLGQGISILKLGSENISVKPGQICSVPYVIQNNSVAQFSVKTKLILPENWQKVTANNDIDIPPMQNQSALLSFRVPGFTRAGNFNIIQILLNSKTDEPIDQFNFNLEVEEVTKITIDLTIGKDQILSGEVYRGKVQVSNLGNSKRQIKLAPQKCEIVDSINFYLDAGESRIVNLVCPAQKGLIKTTNRDFKIKVYVDNEFEKITELYKFYTIIPLKQSNTDLFFRFPLEFSIISLLRNNHGSFRSGLQFNVEGNGFLNEAQTRQLRIKAQGPNQFDLSALGASDEYYVEYTDKNFNLYLGDKNFKLSPLTEIARYGRGIQGEMKIKSWQIGSFYHTPRFYPVIRNEFAVYSKYFFFKKNQIDIYYLKKIYKSDLPEANIFSLKIQLYPFINSKLEAEISRGNSGNLSDWGFYSSYNSNWKKINISAFILYAGDKYPGYYSNTFFYYTRFLMHITNKLTATVNVRQDYKNAAKDTLYGTSPSANGYYAGIGYKLGKNILMEFFIDQKEQQDRMPEKLFHYRERVFRSNFTHQLGLFNYSLHAEIGQTRNYLFVSPQNIMNSYRFASNWYYQLNKSIKIASSLSYYSNNRYSAERESSWIYGASIQARIDKQIYCSFRYQNDYELQEYYRDRSLISSEISWKYKLAHSFSLIGNYTLLQKKLNENDISASISYTYQLGIPIKRISFTGSVSGLVSSKNEENTGGLILHIEEHIIVTDEMGQFTFRNIKPGKHLLSLDPFSSNKKLIPNVAFPMIIEVKEKENTHINFAMVRAAKVEGRILLSKNDNVFMEENIDPKQIYTKIILILKDKDREYKTIPNPDGSFKFTEVIPGKWTLKPYIKKITNKFELEKGEILLNLSPGEKTNLEIKLKQKERKIHIQKKTFKL